MTDFEAVDVGPTDPPSSFLAPPDMGLGSQCDPESQDCPHGTKCSPVDDSGAFVPQCVALASVPKRKGEPCELTMPGVVGHDDCGVGMTCWDMDPETGFGVCLEHCLNGAWGRPYCPDPDEVCAWGKQISLCFPECHPIDQGCPVGCGCYAEAERFGCFPDRSGKGGRYREGCESADGCDPGLTCVAQTRVPDCETHACCTPFCDLNAPTCPDEDMGMRCLPIEGEQRDGYEDVGVCTVAG